MGSRSNRVELGFSLIEVTVALLITLLVMASVFLLLQRGQKNFQREPEVTEMNAATRAGLDRISQDLAVAGFNAPATMPVMWVDGGPTGPDEITIVYGDPEVPVARPRPCAGEPCGTVGRSTALELDPETLSPEPVNFEDTFVAGMKLFALQGPNGTPECESVPPGLVPFELTEPPKCSGTGGVGSGPKACGTLQLTHRPGHAGIQLPPGFEDDVRIDCAVVGVFHVAQYRIFPPPPATGPTLERRDITASGSWEAIASNVENLQVQYAQGMAQEFEDVPSLMPAGNDLNSWVTRVRITVGGRSASSNLAGGTLGVFAAEEAPLRRSFTTTMSLRNQLGQAQQKALELGLDSWN